MKLKKIPKNGNLTNEVVVGFDEKLNSTIGELETTTDKNQGVVLRNDFGIDLTNIEWYVKVSDIAKEARRQIKEMKAAGGVK